MITRSNNVRESARTIEAKEVRRLQRPDPKRGDALLAEASLDRMPKRIVEQHGDHIHIGLEVPPPLPTLDEVQSAAERKWRPVQEANKPGTAAREKLAKQKRRISKASKRRNR